jgi:hypothetical protein
MGPYILIPFKQYSWLPYLATFSHTETFYPFDAREKAGLAPCRQPFYWDFRLPLFGRDGAVAVISDLAGVGGGATPDDQAAACPGLVAESLLPASRC